MSYKKFFNPPFRSLKERDNEFLMIFHNYNYLKIIQRRIEKNKKKYTSNFNQSFHNKNFFLLEKIVLDINSLFLFAHIYLNYLIRYLNKKFFRLNHFEQSSFEKHIFRIKKVFSNKKIQKY